MLRERAPITLWLIATALLGTLAGDWLRSSRSPWKKAVGILVGGAVLSAAGLLLHSLFPINKQLWTPTFVLFPAGAGLLVLGICYILMDVRRWKGWAFPFRVFGTNAILVYVASGLLAKTLGLVKVSASSGDISVKIWIYDR